MKEVLDLVREFGLSLVVAVAASYALYKFFFFSIREVKATFEKRHEIMAKNMEEVKVSLAEVKSDLKVLVEFLKSSSKNRDDYKDFLTSDKPDFCCSVDSVKLKEFLEKKNTVLKNYFNNF